MKKSVITLSLFFGAGVLCNPLQVNAQILQPKEPKVIQPGETRVLKPVDQGKVQRDQPKAIGRMAVLATYQAARKHYQRKEYEQARAKYKQAADAGHLQSQIDYAIMVSEELGGEIENYIQRDTEVLKYLGMAAAQGSVPTMLRASKYILYRGYHGPDKAGAIPFLNQAIKAGSQEAMILLGDCYAYGLGVDKDVTKAYENYKDALDAGYMMATVSIGRLFMEEDPLQYEPQSARTWFEKGHKAQLRDATAEYGWMLMKGLGGIKDVELGVQLIKTAAGKRSLPACFMLYQMYDQGLNVEMNKNQSLLYLRFALRGKYPPAMYAEAIRLKGNSQRLSTASRELIKEAASGSYVPAILHMIELTAFRNNQHHWWNRVANRTGQAEHFLKAGYTTTPVRGLKFFQSAEARGSIQGKIEVLKYQAGRSNGSAAMAELKRLHDSGMLGVADDIADAYMSPQRAGEATEGIAWYIKSGESGHAESYAELGKIYGRGYQSIAKDVSKAGHYYQLAASMGHIDSMLELANAYDTVPNDIFINWNLGYQVLGKDAEIAKLYWVRAAKAGSVYAKGIATDRNWSLD